MDLDSQELRKSIEDVRQARRQAEVLRDLLAAEYDRLAERGRHALDAPEPRFHAGLEAMKKAIAAADRAMANMDQAIREIERVPEDPPSAN